MCPKYFGTIIHISFDIWIFFPEYDVGQAASKGCNDGSDWMTIHPQTDDHTDGETLDVTFADLISYARKELGTYMFVNNFIKYYVTRELTLPDEDIKFNIMEH